MHEYSAGTVFTVDFSPRISAVAALSPGQSTSAPTSSSAKYRLTIQVVRPIEPFTMAATCLVEQGYPAAPLSADVEYVLKVYDRRHANGARQMYRSFWPFDMAREAEFQAFLTASRARQSAGDFGSRELTPPPEMEVELDVQDMVEEAIACEVTAYSRMMSARASGQQPACPLYYGAIECESEIGPLRGILIEYISPSITLHDYLKRAGPCGYLMADVRKICDQVVKAIESTMIFDFNYDDIRPQNILLHWGNGVGQLSEVSLEKDVRPVLIDYGNVRIRLPDETDIEWASEQDLMGADDVFGLDMWCTLPTWPRIPARLTEPVWKFILSETFKLKLSDEHSEIKDALGGRWGY